MVKKFDPFKSVVEHGTLSIGTVGVMGIAGRMPSSPSSGRITGSMDTLRVVPVVHGAGIAMGSLGSLKAVERKIKKR